MAEEPLGGKGVFFEASKMLVRALLLLTRHREGDQRKQSPKRRCQVRIRHGGVKDGI